MPIREAPALLYRYRGTSGSGLDRLKRIVIDGEHHFSSPSTFNDPFDCRPRYLFNSSDKAVREYIDRLFARFAPHLSAETRTAEVDAILNDPNRDPRRPENQQLFAALIGTFGTNNAGVLCLSESGTVPLMWSHYAESHTGVALGYDSSARPFNQALPIVYSKFRPSVDSTIHSQEEILESTLFTKSEDWAYEREWRIVMTSGPGKYQIPHETLKTIIVGALATNELLREVLAWTRSLTDAVEVYRASTSPDTFELDVRRYR